MQRPRIPAAGEGVDRRGTGCNRVGGCVPWGGPQSLSPSLLTHDHPTLAGAAAGAREESWGGKAPAQSAGVAQRPGQKRARPSQRDGDLILCRWGPQPSPQSPRGAQHTAPRDLCPGCQRRACSGAPKWPLLPCAWLPSSHPASLPPRPPTAAPSSQICSCSRSTLWDEFGGAGPLLRHWGGSDDEMRAACVS